MAGTHFTAFMWSPNNIKHRVREICKCGFLSRKLGFRVQMLVFLWVIGILIMHQSCKSKGSSKLSSYKEQLKIKDDGVWFNKSHKDNASFSHKNITRVTDKLLNESNNIKTVPEEYVSFDRDVPIIWVGGVPRSGTTLARAMLDAHPDIRCGEETRVIPRILGMHKAMMESPTESNRLSQAKITNKVLNDAMGAYILNIISKHGESAPRLCNKDPFALKSMNKIMEIFPNSKFLLLVRDGRATCHSIISRQVAIRGFDFNTFGGCLRDWNKAMENMFINCIQQGQSVCMPVRYESLVIHTNTTMQAVLSFLDVPWSNLVLHHEQTIGKKNGVSLSERELSTDQVNKPVNTDALSKWVGEIPNDVLRDMEKIAPMLERLGYDPNANPPNYSEEKIKSLARPRGDNGIHRFDRGMDP